MAEKCYGINKVAMLITLLHVYCVLFIGYFFIICFLEELLVRFTCDYIRQYNRTWQSRKEDEGIYVFGGIAVFFPLLNNVICTYLTAPLLFNKAVFPVPSIP
jgi:hypothetical protein